LWLLCSKVMSRSGRRVFCDLLRLLWLLWLCELWLCELGWGLQRLLLWLGEMGLVRLRLREIVLLRLSGRLLGRCCVLLRWVRLLSGIGLSGVLLRLLGWCVRLRWMLCVLLVRGMG
jgi:hypothetical protein